MSRIEAEAEVLAAAAEWKERCLLRDGSILGDRSLWTTENLEQLERYFVQNLDFGEGNFWEKLEAQLEPATPPAKQLAAEMFWVMYLIVHRNSMTGDTKRLHVRRVWEWSGQPFPENVPVMGSVLDDGVAHPGQSYNTLRWREFKLFIELMQAFKALGHSEREHLLADGWRFGEWLDGHEGATARQFRHILLYLLFPGEFDPIVTGRHKQQIVRTFRKKYGEDPEAVDYTSRLVVDREIKWIRHRAEQEYGDTRVNFYEPPLVSLWRQSTEPSPPAGGSGGNSRQWYYATFGQARVWAIAAGPGARAWGEFQREGIVAIGWDFLGDLDEYESREQIHTALAEERGGGNPLVNALACWQFAREMKPGDYVVVKRGGAEILGWGKVTSDYRYEPDRPEYDHVRDVSWIHTGNWELPRDRRITIKTLTDFSDAYDWLHFAWELSHGGPAIKPKTGRPYTVEDAADGLFMGIDNVRTILDTLARRKNVILQGPPGVGKTFVARRLAYALINYERPAQVAMVQFHQSYAYEDFVQGWRPDGSGGFRLQDGIFHRFANRAAADPTTTYVFIIDEINRGNLSKVLGELMMLIEADKRGSGYGLPLTYSPDQRFHVPENLFIIGLMNTADRSLAMVDYALRRRFGFIYLDPAFTSDEFSRVLSEAGASEPLIRRIESRFTALNEQIRQDRNLGRGFEIGHSYFVPQKDEQALDEAWYESVIEHEIRPLLEEYWFDDPERVETAVRGLRA